MKKIILLLLLFSCALGYSQLNENFDSGMPSDWTKVSRVNGVVVTNQAFTWVLNTAPPATYLAHTLPNAAYVNNENIGAGNTEEDWLITDQNVVPNNGQLRFFTRQTTNGDQLTKYRIYYSTTSQTDLSTFQLLKEFSEGELSDLSGDLSQYEERSADFNTPQFGQSVYIAFVRVYTQLTGLRNGDRWLVDDVKMVEKCKDPFGLGATNIASTTATLGWNNPSLATLFDIEVVIADQEPTGIPNYPDITAPGTNPTTYNITGLPTGVALKYYVRAKCTNSPSGWGGPFIFSTLPLGSVCAGPIVIGGLPYQVVNDNTINYGDEVDTPQGTQCGATPAGTNYLQGNEVFYSFTPTIPGPISILMTPVGTPSGNSSLFVYNGCTVGGTCLGGVANTGSTPRLINMNVVAGTTYVIVISSSAANPSVGYNLLIQYENCLPKPVGQATTTTLTTATLNWDNVGAYSSWQYVVQPLLAGIPQGAGTPAATNTGVFVDNLLPGTQYQYYVRAECNPGSGIFTAWSGPYPFNTQICPDADKCTYTFHMTGTAGWKGAKMEIRQNNILIQEIGPSFTTGTSADVTVSLCNNVQYTVVWTAGGTAQAQVGLSVLNSFGQTIYTKAPGTGAVGTTLYTDVTNCTTPRCDLAPTNVTIDGITTVGGTIHWNSPGTSDFGYDIYVVPAGSPVPQIGDTPTYADVPGPTYTITAPPAFLQPEHTYNVYVRVNCNVSAPAISAAGTFTTLPSCYKPTNPLITAGSITLTGATFTWTPNSPSDTQWEMLIIPGPTAPAALPEPSVPATYTNITAPTYTATDLTNATIYYAYVRTVCSETNVSIWVPFIKFNTQTCNAADKCNYKFVLTNATGNSWNGARMEIRQNGIVIQTIGASGVNGAPISVGLCTGVPFDLYWSVAGTAPENVAISIQNPFLDVVFTKAAGTGDPATVLYSSVTNCTPAPCSKPTAMTATPSPTALSVLLHWTDNSTPPSSLYDLYIVPTGQPAPTNEPPTIPTISGVTNDFVLNIANYPTLLPSTSYTYYVRAVCSSTDFSTWTILSPVIFVTTPANDDCSHAIPVTINPAQVCIDTNQASGNTYGSTASNPVLTPPLTGTGCGPTSNDVWYSFVATSTSHTITLSDVTPIQGSPASTKLNYGVFSGTCGNLTKLYCSTNNTSGATGLVIGQTYYIRVYTTNNNQFATFKLCIITPPANDECANAAPVTVNTGQSCVPANTVSGNTYGATASAPVLTPPLTGGGCGQSNNDVWYSFIAIAPNQTISISNVIPSPATANVNINYSVFSGTCSNLTKLYCSTNANSIATGLTIGSTYYIRVYTATNVADQSASFDLCITSPPVNDECTHAIPVTVNAGQDCSPINTATGNTYGSTPSPSSIFSPVLTGIGCGPTNNDLWYSFVATSPQHTISLSAITPTPANATIKLNYSLFSGTCEAGLSKVYCSTTNTSNTPTLTVGQTYYIRVYIAPTAADQSVTFNLCITSQPANDECINAIEAPVNPTAVCDDKIYGNTIGATPSLPAGTGTNCTGTDDDVWFKFTATNPIEFITLSTLLSSSGGVSLNHSVLSGECGALTNLYCSNQPTSVATGLTVGQTYYIRIYTNGTAVGEWVNFSLCIKSPPPPATNDNCITALPAAVNTDSQCNLITEGNLIGATGSTGVPGGACVGNANDDVWFSFVATASQHFINLLDVAGTSTNLNHAVYTGADCSSLTRVYCSDANSLNSTYTNFVPGQTYYLRVWSNLAPSQIVSFNVCIKSISTCQTAAPFCGSGQAQSLIFPNTTQTPGAGQIACLGSSPNPTFYYLRVEETGSLAFEIRQSTDQYNFPTTGGTSIDVDYVAWGPFNSAQSCDQIAFEDCPTCPNNTTNANFYPFGNIVDCSYDAAPVETLHIPNAVAGDYYLLLVTNFNGAAGYIKLFQSNFGQAGTGQTTNLCCEVDAGPDVVACGSSYILNALANSDSTPTTYQWSFNGSVIPNAVNALYTATATGYYTVKGFCGLNTDEYTIHVTLLPAIPTGTVADYILCDDATNNGDASFDLSTLTASALGTLTPASDFIVTYYTTELGAALSDPTKLIDISVPFVSMSTTIYIRVQRIDPTTCYQIIPVNLVVTPLPDSTFDYSAAAYCINSAPFINTVTPVTGVFTTDSSSISVDPVTGQINTALSFPGTYHITNTPVVNGCTGVPTTREVILTAPKSGAFSYPDSPFCSNAAPGLPLAVTGSELGHFETLPLNNPDLILNATTGEITVIGSVSGATYTIVNIIDGIDGCGEVRTTTQVTINPLPDPSFLYSPDVYCKDASDPTGNVTTNIGEGHFSAQPAGLVFLNDVTGQINLAASDPGDYTIVRTIAADPLTGCGQVTSAPQIVKIVGVPSAVFNYGGGDTFCNGGGVATASVNLPNDSFVVTSSGGGNLDIDPATGEINLGNSDLGVYDIKHTVIAPPCGNVDFTFTVTISDEITGALAYATPLCTSTTLGQLPTVAPPPGGAYTVDPVSGLSINGTTGEILPSASNSGTYTVKYHLDPPAGSACDPLDLTASVVIVPTSEFNIEYGCESNDYQLKAVATDPGSVASYVWEGPAFTYVDASHSAIIVTATGMYKVTVTTNNGGCISMQEFNATDISCDIQKGISPNHDGKNDSFDLTALHVKHLTIYNRYGTEVYQTKNYTNQWFGQSSSGEELPDATYFYVIEKQDGQKKTGWIYVNR